MILVYSDSQHITDDWLTRITFSEDIEICHDFDQYINSPIKNKVAFVSTGLVQSFRHHLIDPWTWESNFDHNMIQLSDTSRCVFYIVNEFHWHHIEAWERCYRDNIYYVTPGFVNNNKKLAEHSISSCDVFRTTADVYRHFPSVLEPLHIPKVKFKYFDALLGSPKPHRDFVYNNVLANKLEDKVEMVYGGYWESSNKFKASDKFIYEPGIEILDDTNTYQPMRRVKYNGRQCWLCQVIPTEVYNNTAYSIVTETDCDNRLSFYSEKTAKPIIGKRLFVAFSGQYFLHNLRSLGFKTFDDIIDEGYDSIQDSQERWQAAFNQVKYLCSAEQQEIYEKIKPIVDYNYDLLMSTDWIKYSCDQISNTINI
jgi:hypothetical protein